MTLTTPNLASTNPHDAYEEIFSFRLNDFINLSTTFFIQCFLMYFIFLNKKFAF